MFSLEDLLGQQQGNEAVNQVSQRLARTEVGQQRDSDGTAGNFKGLANNAATPQGAQNLDNALQNDHDGSILDNLGGLGS